MQKIFIKGLRIQVIIGVYDWERTNSQEVLINVTMMVNTPLAGSSDKIEDCVDYSVLVEEIKQIASISQRYTVEALAEDIVGICLQRNKVIKAIVRVEKPGIIPNVDSVGVEIERDRNS